jgi:hypothetical protein
LVKLADEYGIDIPLDLERIFIIEELLEITFDDEDEESVEPLIPSPGFQESVPLPKQYSITYLEIMIRDPLWVYAFWEIKAHDKEICEGAADFGGYYLRVKNLEEDAGEHSFTVPVELTDTAWYLGFPPPVLGIRGGRFLVELCAIRGNGDYILCSSRPFTMPKLLSSAGGDAGAGGNSGKPQEKVPALAQLSGADEFPVIRNADRQSRSKRCGSSRVA